MPEVKHFHDALIFTDLVVDQNPAMEQLANARSFSNGASHAGKTSQQVHMVEQALPKR
jgi:hypothetical protein